MFILMLGFGIFLTVWRDESKLPGLFIVIISILVYGYYYIFRQIDTSGY